MDTSINFVNFLLFNQAQQIMPVMGKVPSAISGVLRSSSRQFLGKHLRIFAALRTLSGLGWTIYLRNTANRIKEIHFTRSKKYNLWGTAHIAGPWLVGRGGQLLYGQYNFIGFHHYAHLLLLSNME